MEVRPPAGKVSLHTGISTSDAWDSVVLPWFKHAATKIWERSAPVAVVVPSRSLALFLRERLLRENLSLLDVHFLTPIALREKFAPQNRMPSHENLRLLLSLAAELESASPSPAAKSVANSPDRLLRAVEELGAAGWDFDQVGTRELREIVKRFRALLLECDFQLPYETDRAVASAASPGSLFFSELLVAGFDGAHWPLWPLLFAAVRAAEGATVILNDPRDEARALDETWIGTWEQHFGPATPVGIRFAAHETLFPDLFETPLEDANAQLPGTKQFFVGRDATGQANAIVALVRHFLAQPDGKRIGVLFPAAGALHRLVAAALTSENIPHHDAIAHLAPVLSDDAAWRAWLELQENPRLRMLCRFLHASPTAAGMFGTQRAEQVEKILRGAYCHLLIDDLDLLREFCLRRDPRPEAKLVADGLQTLGFLPERATLAEYLANTREIFQRLKWPERQRATEQASRIWKAKIDGTVSLPVFLRWLAEVNDSLLPTRDRIGDHPYSRVHLLFYPHAEGEEWSHLVCAGLNEGVWPPREDESSFLSDGEIEAFNTRLRRLNRAAIRQGRQGEGHSIMAEGKTFFLGASERRELADRQLRNLLETATHVVALTANLTDDETPDRLANPSEFFTRSYYETLGEPPSQATLNALQKETCGWLANEMPQARGSELPDLQQTAIAYHARQAPERPFGEYEFALSEPPAKPVMLSATDWEHAIKTPALVWLKRFLGVEAEEDEFTNWLTATGQWAHRWLSFISDDTSAFTLLPGGKTISARVREAGLRFRAQVTELLSSIDRLLPEWWISGWKNAVYVAERLAERVGEIEGWPHCATEWCLPPDSFLHVRGKNASAVPLSGRIDLLLANEARTNAQLPFSDFWVIDYKTGNRKGLVPKKLVRGDGIQLALYALALRGLGAERADMSVAARALALDKPQLTLETIEEEEEIWRALARMAQSGVFGMRGELRAEFGFQNDYPLATLGVDRDLLEEKWAATYPELVPPNE